MFLARRQQLLTQLRQTRASPQRQSQVHFTELPRAFDADFLQAHRHVQMTAAVIEQTPLLRRTDQGACKRLRFEASLIIEFAKMRHGLLNDAPTHSHAADQAPVAMDFAVLLASCMAQVHAAYQDRQSRKRKQPKSALHDQIP